MRCRAGSFFIAFLPVIALATSRGDRIQPEHFDTDFLVRLVGHKIDSLRAVANLHGLEWNAALASAAQHHASYLLEKNLVSHHEKNLGMHTPVLRAQYYGFFSHWVGENVAQSYVSFAPPDTSANWAWGDTYEDVANDLVDLWVRSPGHRSNFLRPDYHTTGVAVAVNYVSGKIYAVQVFGGRDTR